MVRFVAGVLIGGIAVLGFLLVSDDGDSGSDLGAAPSSTTHAGVTSAAATTSTSEAPWVSIGEARFESTVLIPNAMWIESGVATLEYELATLGPMRPSFLFEHGSQPGWIGEYGPAAAQPEEWLLMIGDESIEGTPSVFGTAVRFQVSDNAILDDVVEVRLTRWRVAMPFHHVFEMPLVSGETVVLPDGASIAVRRLSKQRNGTSVEFDTQRPDGDAVAGSSLPFYISPVSDEWQLSRGGSMGDRFQVLVGEETAEPESVLLRYTKPMWMPVDGEIVVWAGEGS